MKVLLEVILNLNIFFLYNFNDIIYYISNVKFNILPDIFFLMGIFLLFLFKLDKIKLFKFSIFLISWYVISLYFFNINLQNIFTDFLDLNFEINKSFLFYREVLNLFSIAGLLIYFKLDKISFRNLNYFLFIVLSLNLFISVTNILVFYIIFESVTFLTICLLFLNSKNSKNALSYFFISFIASIIFIKSVVFLFNDLNSFNFKLIFNLNNELIIKQYYNLVLSLFLFFFIKLGAAPFIFWMIEIYNSVNLFVFFNLMVLVKSGFLFSFFHIFTKINIFNYFALFIKNDFNYIIQILQQTSYIQLFIIGMSFFSIIFGSFGLISIRIKNILLFSSVNQLGFIFLCCCFFFYYPILNVFYLNFLLIFFILVYIVTLCFLLILLTLNNKEIINITGLLNYMNLDFKYTIIFCVLLFSFSGIPIFLGFFSKFFIFLEIYNLSIQLNFKLFIWLIIFIFILNFLILSVYLYLIFNCFFFSKNYYIYNIQQLKILRLFTSNAFIIEKFLLFIGTISYNFIIFFYFYILYYFI